MKLRGLKWIVAIVLLLAAVVLVAVLYRDSLGREIVNAALKDTDYSVTGLSVSSLSRDQVTLAELTLEHVDGTRIIVEGVTLPVNIRERRIDSLTLDSVRLEPAEDEAGQSSYSELLQSGLRAHELAPNIELKVGVVAVPWLPDLFNVVWQTSANGQTIDFDVDDFIVAASVWASDAEHDVVVAVTAEDGQEALAFAGTAELVNADTLLAGDVEAVMEYWLRVLHALGAVPEELKSLSGLVHGTTSALVPAKPDQVVLVTGILRSDETAQLSYVSDDQTEVDIITKEISDLDWSFAYPSLDWVAALPGLQPSLAVDGGESFELQLGDIACRSGIECELLVGFQERGLANEELKLAVIEISMPIAVTIGDVLTVRSTKPATVHLEGLSYGAWSLPVLDLNGVFSLVDTIYSANMKLRAGAGISGEIKASFADDSRKGKLEFSTARIDFAKRNASAVFARWPYEWDLLGGKLDATGELRLTMTDSHEIVEGDVDVELVDVAGSYDELAFTGLNTTASAKLNRASTFEFAPVDVAIELFDVGFPVENIRATIAPDLDRETVAVSAIEMQTLGGTVTADPFSYSLTAETNQFVLRPAGLQLQLMIDLIQSEILEAEGSVSGKLPVNMSGDKVTMDNGHMESDAPGGAIRYLSEIPGASVDSQLGVVSRALSNFEFDSLTSDVAYTEAGDLLMQMRLEGVNPNVDPTQPVVVNLKLENNVPQLLKSLQAARSISDILGRKFAN
jgi:hypothetical protein